MCMALTLTFKMRQVQMQLCQSKAYTYDLLFDGGVKDFSSMAILKKSLKTHLFRKSSYM